MIVPSTSPHHRPPKASRKFERDTAVRFKEVPLSAVEIVGDVVRIPDEFLLVASSDLRKLAFRIGALEEHMRMGTLPKHTVASAVKAGAASPLPDNVSPIGASSKAEKSEATQTSVPGNEAEVLEPEDQVLALPAPPKGKDNFFPRLKNVVPRHIPQPKNPGLFPGLRDEEAANDADSEEVEDYIRYEDTLDRYCEKLGYSHEEAKEIFAQHMTRADAECRRVHGESQVTVRLARTLNQPSRQDVFFSCETSRFLDWSANLIGPMLPALTRLANIRMGRITTQKRHESLRKQELKAGRRGAKWYRNQHYRAVMSLAHDVEVPTTSMLQLRAWRLWWNDKADAVRRGLGLETNPNRAAKALAKYADDPDWTQRFAPLYTMGLRSFSVKGWKTVWTVASATPWPGLDVMTVRERMDTINDEIMRRGLFTPLSVSIMQGHLEHVFGDKQLDAMVTVNK